MPKRKAEEFNSPKSQLSKRIKLDAIENGIEEIPQNERSKIHCSCRRISCLKSYCECFKRGEMCTPECSCTNCKNAPGSEELIKINELKIKKQNKRFKNRVDGFEYGDEEQIERVNKLQKWLTSESIRELGVVLLKEIQKEEKTFEKQYQFMTQQSSLSDGINSTNSPSTPKSHSDDKETLSPETINLLCDETDAVQAASRPKLTRTPSQKDNILPDSSQPDIDRETELKQVLEKKILITFKKRLTDILSDMMS